MKHRIEWMDFLRGTAIILVIAWHAPVVPALVGFEAPQWLVTVNDFFRPFRMPTLMFLSGMLLKRSLSKDLRTYYAGKLQGLAWPYLLWVAVYLVIFPDGGSIFSPSSWIAAGYLWFLFFVTCYFMAAPAVRRVPPWALVLACLCASALFENGSRLDMLFYFGAFFFAGYWASLQPAWLEELLRPRWIAPLTVAALGVGVASAVIGPDLAFRAELAPLSFAGIAALILLARTAAERRWARSVNFMGKNSIVYYTTHYPIIMACVYALTGLSVNNGGIIAVVGFCVATAFGTFLAVYRSKVPLAWLFAAPKVFFAWLTPRRVPAKISAHGDTTN